MVRSLSGGKTDRPPCRMCFAGKVIKECTTRGCGVSIQSGMGFLVDGVVMAGVVASRVSQCTATTVSGKEGVKYRVGVCGANDMQRCRFQGCLAEDLALVAIVRVPILRISSALCMRRGPQRARLVPHFAASFHKLA